MLLAIETSCDETAVALCLGFELQPVVHKVASQVALHEAYGGVVPELAARQHILTLPLLVTAALKEINAEVDDVKAIGVTVGPGLQGCLLVGVSYAKAFAQAKSIPLFPVHHIEGHIAATHLSEDGEQLEYPALSLIVSGGHTMIVEIDGFRQYSLIAETRDDAAGEAFDKIASLLKLPYPGGPSLSKLADSGDPFRFEFPRAVANDRSSFSFSGLKTAVAREVSSLGEGELEEQSADLAASAQLAIVDALVDKLFLNFDSAKHKSIVLTGGVAANRLLRDKIREKCLENSVKLQMPEIKYCTDNAAMIGVIAQQLRVSQSDEIVSWDPEKSLGPNAPFSLGARSRWPFHELVS